MSRPAQVVPTGEHISGLRRLIYPGGLRVGWSAARFLTLGYLLHLILAALAFGAAQAGVGLASISWPWALTTLALPHALALLVDRAGRAGRFRLTGLTARLPALAAPLAFAFWALGTNWLEACRGWTGARLSAGAWPEFALFLAFAPYPILQAVAVHAEVGQHAPPGAARRKAYCFQLRMLVSALAPAALYVYVTAQVGVFDSVRVQVQEVGLVNAGFLAALLTALALFLPTVLTSAWDTVSMPASPQRDVLDEVARRASFRPRDVRLWRTGHMMSNAAIVGVGGRRVVLFSDSLLASLPPRELAAVYGHEIGHAKRRHVAVFLVWTLAFFIGGDWLATEVALENDWAAAGILLSVLALWTAGFGWLSRRCELEADLYSLELLQDPASMTLALERVAGRLTDTAGWRHFSSRARVAFLWRAWADAEFAARFRRRLSRIAWTGTVCFVLAAGAQLWSLVVRYPEDRVRAELALGRWDRALERARKLEELEGADLAMLTLGADRQGARDRLPVEELEGGLAESLTGRAWQRCEEYAGLLVLAGRGEIAPVLEACEAASEGRLGEARDLAGSCPERWRRLLREVLGR